MEKLTNTHGLITTANFLAHVIDTKSDIWEDGGDGSIIAADIEVTDRDASRCFAQGDMVESMLLHFGETSEVEVPHPSIQGRDLFPDGSAILEIEGEFVEEDND